MTFPRPATPHSTRSPRHARTLSSVAFALIIFLYLGVRPAHAQDETTATPEEVVRVRTDLVTVPVFVTGERGRRVSGLGRDDFEVLDNGRRVETVYFAAGAESVALLFLLDASGSTREIITRQRETALAIFSRFGERSRVAVMQFRERPELTLPFTRDINGARAAFQTAALPDRRTAIFDASAAAVRAFLTPEAAPTERRIVVLVSDGLDTVSATRADAVASAAREAGVSFYVIHLPLYTPSGDGRLVARRPAKGFRELAERTGGQFFVVGDARASLDPRATYDLQNVFQAIADDLLGQYVLGYYAGAEQTGGFHRVTVRLTRRGGRNLRVRQLREGYDFKGGDAPQTGPDE